MKSKTSLILWGLMLSLILNGLVTFLSYHNGPDPEYYSCIKERQERESLVKLADGRTSVIIIDYIQPCVYGHVGWPIKIPYFELSRSGPLYLNRAVQLGLFLNNIILFTFSLMILGILKYLRNNNPSSNIVH